MNAHALLKIESHLHLNCCLSYDAVRRLAPEVTSEAFARDFIAPPKCRSLAEYLRTPPHHVALMQSEEALRLVVDDLFAQLARDGVIYAEIRFAPLFHTRRGLSSEQVVAIVDDAVARASAASGIEARIILATLRHFSEAQSLETVRLVERFRGTRVAAFDIAGDEAGYPLDAHLAAFRFAIEHGIPRTAHAGEAAGPASVWETLRLLQPPRHRPRGPQHRGRGAHGAPGRDRHPPGGVPDLQRADRRRAGVQRSSGGSGYTGGASRWASAPTRAPSPT